MPQRVVGIVGIGVVVGVVGIGVVVGIVVVVGVVGVVDTVVQHIAAAAAAAATAAGGTPLPPLWHRSINTFHRHPRTCPLQCYAQKAGQIVG